ncbi:MAG: endonuclease [Frankiales bacterium]|nr:endonuclease [Frankiales bacterium]
MRLATWNILHGRSLDDGRVDVARLRAAVTAIDADVLGLQEVDRDQDRSHRADLTASLAPDGAQWRFAPALLGTPGTRWRAATARDEPGPAYGVALVTRLPAQDWDVLHLAPARLRAPVLIPGTRRVVWIRDEPRVALSATVHGPYGPWTVATTHLSFVPGWNAAQLRRVARWLRTKPGPRILIGDLNLPAGLARRLTGWQPLARHSTHPALRPRVQLDHLLGDGALPAVRKSHSLRLPVSDHRALVVEL